jgi:6-phosphogluconolactonase
MFILILALFLQLMHPQVQSYLLPSIQRRSSRLSTTSIANHQVYDDADAVGKALCSYIASSAQTAIAARNRFSLCIPGGSAVKLLRYLQPHDHDLDWSKVSIYYVNHKCVPNDDQLATHAKAKKLFLDSLTGVRVYTFDDSLPTAEDRARAYEAALKASLPIKDGLPRFDLVVLGMGKDGHIGSLYPGRKELEERQALVVAVDKVSSVLKPYPSYIL